MRILVLALLIAGCGGAAPESVSPLAGVWQQTPIAISESFMCMSVKVHGATVDGIGAFEGGENPRILYFAVAGSTTQLVLTFPGARPSASPETFTLTQPDPDHLQLTNALTTLTLRRASSADFCG
jgi:hypothetical protein